MSDVKEMAVNQERVALTGNEAMALAMRQIEPDVVAAYPITPQTEIVQIFSTYVADGLVNTEYVPVESEHSAMSAVVGSAAAGARSMTATSANGLALMWEILYIASGTRLPIVMPVVNRALSGPINIHCDHSDTMGARDAGWIQIFSENAQEAYDNMIQAIRISEHPDVLLPAMVTTDGFIISHGMEIVHTMEDSVVKDFIGEYKIPRNLLDVDNPITVGPLALQDFYFETKVAQADAMEKSKAVIKQIADEFEKLSGRKYDFFEEYKMEDAEVALVALGSTAGTAKVVVDNLRKEGIKAGLLKIRVFRPFPYEELIEALKNVPVIGVMDRSHGFASEGGPVFSELRAAMYHSDVKPIITNYVYGLGGRDIDLHMIEQAYRELLEIKETGKVERYVNYLGVRE